VTDPPKSNTKSILFTDAGIKREDFTKKATVWLNRWATPPEKAQYEKFMKEMESLDRRRK